MTVTPQQLAQTLLARQRSAGAHFAQRAQSLRERVGQLAKQAAPHDGVWIIGSLASGLFGDRSDVDVVVRGVHEDRVVALWSDWSCTLGERLDLLRFEDLPESFQARVVAEGIRVA